MMGSGSGVQPTDSRRRRVLAGALCAAVASLFLVASAGANSVSVTTRDAGGGAIEATVQSSVACESTFCAWFAHAVERHSSLPCRDDTTFIRWVGSYHEGGPSSATETFTFRPFFPRTTKLCVFLQGPGGLTVSEATIALPAGYGMQRSSGYNCSNFGRQAAAQYYLLLYPGDPSGLDADNDGFACEHLSCPCGAEPIPAEPEPAPPPPIVLPPTKGRAYLPFISTDTFRCNRLRVSAGREGWELTDIGSSEEHPFTARIELKLRGLTMRATRLVVPGAKRTIKFGWVPAGQYSLSVRYPGDEWHKPSHTKTLRPKVHSCRR
jgi:hypothetical protein